VKWKRVTCKGALFFRSTTAGRSPELTCYQNYQPDLFSRPKSATACTSSTAASRRSGDFPTLAKIKPHKLKGDGDFRSEQATNVDLRPHVNQGHRAKLHEGGWYG
jgi:hypothetical protein